MAAWCLMILWTTTTTTTWKELNRRGVLVTNPKHSEVYKHSKSAYQWMAGQMESRIGPPPRNGILPFWAWHRWDGEHRPKPDLRSGGHLPPGEKGVRIEFEKDPKEVLLSDFVLWHHVLNYWYLPKSQRDSDRFDNDLEKRGLSFYKTKPLTDERYHNRIERSWERIFDLEWENSWVTGPKSEKAIQATFWSFHLSEVRRIKEFTAR